MRNRTSPAGVGAQQSLAARLLLLVVHGYQHFLSPLLGPHCRFAPSCSHYAAQALTTHGALRGTALAGRRLLRCHPFNPGGHDPVPPARSRAAADERQRTSLPAQPVLARLTAAPLTARSRAGVTP